MSDNVIPFPQQMTNEEVELLAIEKEIETVNKKVRELAIDLENANNYLQSLLDEHAMYKHAVEKGEPLIHVEIDFDDDWED